MIRDQMQNSDKEFQNWASYEIFEKFQGSAQ